MGVQQNRDRATTNAKPKSKPYFSWTALRINSINSTNAACATTG